MKQDTNIGTNILRVSASDEDADNNGAIRYSITAPVDPTDLDYFDIQPESGWIYLRKPLDVSHSISLYQKKKFRNYTAFLSNIRRFQREKFLPPLAFSSQRRGRKILGFICLLLKVLLILELRLIVYFRLNRGF